MADTKNGDAKTAKEMEAGGQICTVDGNKDGYDDKEDVADEILQEEEPKVPRVDAYYVVMAVILGLVLMGLLVYFAYSSIVGDELITVKPDDMAGKDKDYMTTMDPEMAGTWTTDMEDMVTDQ